MEVILTAVSSVFTAAVTMVTTVGETIVAEPILLLYAVLPLVGIGIGLFRRLISVN